MGNASEFYDRIKMLVKHRNTTILDLCVAVDFNLGTYNVSRKRQLFLRSDVVARMAEILEVSVDFLLTGREHRQPVNQKQDTLLHIIYALEGEYLNDALKALRHCLRDQKEAKANKTPLA